MEKATLRNRFRRIAATAIENQRVKDTVFVIAAVLFVAYVIFLMLAVIGILGLAVKLLIENTLCQNILMAVFFIALLVGTTRSRR